MEPKKYFGSREISDYAEKNALVLVILTRKFVRITRSSRYNNLRIYRTHFLVWMVNFHRNGNFDLELFDIPLLYCFNKSQEQIQYFFYNGFS